MFLRLILQSTDNINKNKTLINNTNSITVDGRNKGLHIDIYVYIQHYTVFNWNNKLLLKLYYYKYLYILLNTLEAEKLLYIWFWVLWSYHHLLPAGLAYYSSSQISLIIAVTPVVIHCYRHTSHAQGHWRETVGCNVDCWNYWRQWLNSVTSRSRVS